MKVLSLFDGMSCGRIALDQLNIPIDTYYASEIDKYAIQVTQANYPSTIQVGDICNLDPKDYQDVDLIFAGSPCQGFSFGFKCKIVDIILGCGKKHFGDILKLSQILILYFVNIESLP